MGPKKLLQLHFYFVVLFLCSFVCAKPAPALFRDEKIEKQQELVGKIVDLIKREQIRMNLIEDDNKAEILNEKSVREEIENMIDENRFVYLLKIRQSKINSLSVAGPMGQMNRRPSI